MASKHTHHAHAALRRVWREATLHDLTAVPWQVQSCSRGCRLGPHRLTHSVVTRSTPGATPNPSTGPLPWDAASSRTVHTSSQGQGLAACGLHCPPCWLRKMLLALNISKPKKKKNPCLTSTSSQLYHVLGQTSSILLSAYFTWHRVI